MDLRERLNAIPKGNTCAGVNRLVVELLLAEATEARRMLDVPCGNGEFAQTLAEFFPQAQIVAADLSVPTPTAISTAKPSVKPIGFHAVDASRPFDVSDGQKFDAIACVSGVMEFDNTRQFLETLRTQLAPGGALIVTNDNVLTVRDRFAWLFFGRTRLFATFAGFERPTWKLLTIGNLVRIVHDAGFAIESIDYVPVRGKDWLLAPMALLLWPLQWLAVRAAKSSLPLALRRQMLPFASLLSRHYVVMCRARA